MAGLRPDMQHPITAGALCGKVSRYLDAVNGPDRLLHPLRRVGPKGSGEFVRIGWEEAIARVATGLERSLAQAGPESILPYYFAGTMGLVQGWTLGPRLFRHLGASRLLTTICSAAYTSAAQHTLGASVGYDPEDLEHARLILLWGMNPLNSAVHQWKFISRARAQGAHVVAIDPIRTDSAARCDQHIAPLPGTDGALALGLMRAVVDAGAEDRPWLEAHTVGWPSLEARLTDWPVERAAEICGLDVAVVRSLGSRLAETRPTAIRVGLGLQRHGGAGAACRAILAIPALTGDWRHVGGGVVGSTGGLQPFAVDETVEPADMPAPPARSVNMSRVGEALTTLDDPPILAMVVFNANPAASNPNQRLLREGLEREDLFTVVLEQRLTDTSDYADVVLPVTMQPEHLDLSGAYGHLYVQWNEPAVAPPGECLPNTEVFRRIARALGLTHPRLYDSDEEIARQLLDTPHARRRGLSVESLRQHGWQRGGPFDRGGAPYANGGFPTPSGKVELWSQRLETTELDPLIGYTPPHEIGDPDLARRYPLVLMAPAGRFFLNSTFGSIKFHQDRMGPPVVHLNPDDARVRRLADGDQIRVFNSRGSFMAEVLIDDAPRPGVAFLYKNHWPKLLGGRVNSNQTTPERDADMGGSPTFHDNRVEVEAVRVGGPAAQELALPGSLRGI